MNIELATIEDFNELKTMLTNVHKELQVISAQINNKTVETLGSKQICKRLKISYPVFLTRATELTRFGLYKDGQWKMKSTDLDRYITFKMNN